MAQELYMIYDYEYEVAAVCLKEYLNYWWDLWQTRLSKITFTCTTFKKKRNVYSNANAIIMGQIFVINAIKQFFILTALLF